MSPQARQILLDMKGRLSGGWTQGASFALTPGGSADEARGCILGAGVLSAAVPLRQQRVAARDGGIPGRGYVAGASVAYYDLNDSPALVEALEALATEAGIPGHADLATWNDAPGRTQADVVALIDQTLNATAPAGAREEQPA